MKAGLRFSAFACLAACAGASRSEPAADARGLAASTRPAAFATIEEAPPSPFPDLPPPFKPLSADDRRIVGPPVDDRVKASIRIFPQSDRALGVTNQALLGGRIVLRDGCFYVTGPNKPDRLAYFGHEVAIGLDDHGHLTLRTRGATPRYLGRIGEQFSWAGPIGAPESMFMVAELRARCGDAPLEHVGIPESARFFRVRPWVVDAIAQRRKIGRGAAWRMFRACLEEKEAGRPGAPFDCDVI